MTTQPYGGLPYHTDGTTTMVGFTPPSMLWVCQTCGGAVADWQKHLRWHATQERGAV